MAKMPNQSIQEQLPRIKKNVERGVRNFKDNNKRFHHFQKFVFKSALSEDDKSKLNATGKPDIEFNITNAPISRLCGEFSKQEPSFYVSASVGNKVEPAVIEVVDGHLRHIVDEAKKHNTQFAAHRDQLSGGFSDFEVWTEYAHEMSFDQVIRFGRTFEPTLVGYDPLAREVDKSDASFCFKMFHKDKDEIKEEYPDLDLDSLQYAKMDDDFTWSYVDERDEKVVIIVDYYEYKKVKKKIVKLADDRVMTVEDYNEFLEQWNKEGHIEQPPAMVTEPRQTTIKYVCRYRLVENKIIEYKETDFKNIPLVFVDGDSVYIKENDDGKGTIRQFTKPYIYHAEGIQRLTNFSGQVIANDFEMMVMHKFMIAEESLPTDERALKALTDVQKAQTVIWKARDDDNPELQNPPPTPVQRVPLPQEVLGTFNNSMQMLQNILGAYDAALGINDNQLSGVAIVEAATQSNAAAMPYIVNYMQALTRVANIIVDLMPKYYKTPRTIPVLRKDGSRDFVPINQEGGIKFNYDENALQVRVEAGVSFAIAKNKALQQIIALMQASPLFAQFINSEGLDIILDNVEFRGSDIIKERAQGFMKKIQQAQAQHKNQPTPEQIQAQAVQQQLQNDSQRNQIEAQKASQKGEEITAKTMLDTEKLLIEKAKVDNQRLEILLKAGESKEHIELGIRKAEAEEVRAKADLAIKHHDNTEHHVHNTVKLAHEISQSHREERDKKEINETE